MGVQVTKPTNKKRRQRRHYSPEYKAEVISLIQTSGKSISQIARELELCESSVRYWMGGTSEKAAPGAPSAKASGAKASTQAELEAENQELRKRVRELEMERSILKKATAFFARESS